MEQKPPLNEKRHIQCNTEVYLFAVKKPKNAFFVHVRSDNQQNPAMYELPLVKKLNTFNRIKINEVQDAAQTIWPKKTAETIAAEATKILNHTYKRKFVFYNGKSYRYLVGGLFYLLGFRFNAVKKQRELADLLCTSDVTIRKAYRSWLETFPDLFLDVIAKLAADKELRYYVLLDLKPALLQAEAKLP